MIYFYLIIKIVLATVLNNETFYVKSKIAIATVSKYKTFKPFYILRPLFVIKEYSNANIAFIDAFDY